VRRLAGFLGLLAAALLMSSCQEVTTQVKDSTFVVTISASSPFVDNGDYLVGDSVQFTGTVTEDGSSVSASGQRFTSDDPGVVEILDVGTGEAAFVGTGTAVVSVTYEQPQLQGSEKLQASMTVRVTTYTVELSLISELTGNPVSPDSALGGDTVRVVAIVQQDGEDVPSSGEMVTSSDAAVAEPVAGTSDQVAFKQAGTATLRMTLQEPDIPGPAPLTSTLDVTVTDLAVSIVVESLVDPSFLANGDTLVTDSVQFSAVVIEGGDTVPTTGPNWASSDPSIIRIIDAASGVAVFEDTGQATVSVSFQTPDLPGEPFGRDIRVTTYMTEVEVASIISGGALADTLVTDSVIFSAKVTATKDGQVVPSSLSTSASDNSSVVNILVPDEGRAVFADTGSATVTLTLAQPQLPDSILQTSLALRVTTFLAQISQVDPDSSPTMGDSIRYGVTVTDTRDNSTVSNPDVTFSSSDPLVIVILDPATGSAVARDTGQSVVKVVVNDPSLPAGIVADSLPPTVMNEEFFYGAFSDTVGEFGNTPSGDTIVVQRSLVHSFTALTQVEFPNGTIGFVDSVTADRLVFLVPAGADTGQLLMRNLVDDQGNARDNVPTRITFDGPGSDAIPDFYEPNDTLPLTTGVEITPPFPFEALESWDPRKSAPADSDFFYFTVPSPEIWTLDILAEWQVNADIDFKVCPASGDPPTSYDPDLCPRPVGNNSTDPRREEEIGLILSAGRYIINFYCVTCPALLPLTYKVTIEKQ